jgi:AcrR family transcriptional regulator
VATRVKGRSAGDVVDRRHRVISVARELAAEGGPDAVQMRTVAERAEVSIVTLYRLVPSKNALLGLVTMDQVQRFWDYNEKHPIMGGTRGERVADVFKRAFRETQKVPKLGHAMFTTFGGVQQVDDYFPPNWDRPTRMLTDVAIRALESDGAAATEMEHQLVQMTRLVWSGALGQWLSGTMSTELAFSMIDLASAQIDHAGREVAANGARTQAVS